MNMHRQDKGFNNGKQYYPCPAQRLQPIKQPPEEKPSGFHFQDLKEPCAETGTGFVQGHPEDSAPRRVDMTPQDENLPVIQATVLTKFDVVMEALAEVASFKTLVVDLRDKKTFKEVKAAKSKVRALRLKIQNREKEENSKLTKAKADLKKDATTLRNPIKETEDYLAGEIKKWTDEEARLKQIEDEKEAARRKIIDSNFDLLVQVCGKGLIPGLLSADIKTALDVLHATTTPQDVFGERYQDACNHLGFSIENTQRAYDDAVIYETRQADLVRIEAEAARVAQVGWFNDNFGVMADLETMEAGLEHLETGLKLLDAASYDNLALLIKSQIEQGRTIIERTKAAMPDPEPEPVEETPAPQEKTQVICDTEILTEGFEETPDPEKEAPRGTTREIDTAREIPGIKSSKAPEKTQAAAQDEKAPEDSKPLANNLETIKAIIKTAAPGSLELILSNGQASAPIMLSPEGRDAVMVLVKSDLENSLKVGGKNDKG